jgi:arylsulfatase
MKNKFRFLFPILLSFFISKISFAQTLRKSNFILYLTDDIGWNDIGCYGNSAIKTPNIDRLATEGLKFQNAYLTTSSCSPSRCSLITSRYPHNTGAPELFDYLPEGQVMFPELLRDAGYYTALSGKNHMGDKIAAAFDTVSLGKGPGGEEDWVDLIKNRPAGKPFFFWFASHDAHRDWQFDKNGMTYEPDNVKVPPMLFDGPLTRKDLAGYYHEISRADFFLGELIKELQRQKILDNTYIIFMSDNGRPFPRCKTRLYDSGIKTPFIVYGPNIKPGLTDALISSIDVAPTILDLANISKEDRMQGVSFLPILKNAKANIRDFAFAEHNWHTFKNHERMVRYGQWMYIRNSYPGRRNLASESTDKFPAGKELWDAHNKHLTKPEQEDVFMVPRPIDELYNVKSDPYQFHNLAGDKKHMKIISFLSNVLNSWIKETGDSKPTNPTPDRKESGWKKGEKPGEINNADKINNPGPIRKT